MEFEETNALYMERKQMLEGLLFYLIIILNLEQLGCQKMMMVTFCV